MAGKRYKCPICGAIADIDLEKKRMVLEPRPPDLPSPRRGVAVQVAYSSSSHGDCEFNKPIDKINLARLDRVE